MWSGKSHMVFTRIQPNAVDHPLQHATYKSTHKHCQNISSKTKADNFSFLWTPTRSLLMRTSPTKITIIITSTAEWWAVVVSLYAHHKKPILARTTVYVSEHKEENKKSGKMESFDMRCSMSLCLLLITCLNKSAFPHTECGTLPETNNGNFN